MKNENAILDDREIDFPKIQNSNSIYLLLSFVGLLIFSLNEFTRIFVLEFSDQYSSEYIFYKFAFLVVVMLLALIFSHIFLIKEQKSTSGLKMIYHLCFIIVGYFMFSSRDIISLTYQKGFNHFGLIFIIPWLFLIVFSNRILKILIPTSSELNKLNSKLSLSSLYTISIKVLLNVFLIMTIFDLMFLFVFPEYVGFKVYSLIYIITKIVLSVILIRKYKIVSNLFNNKNATIKIRDLISFILNIIGFYLILTKSFFYINRLIYQNASIEFDLFFIYCSFALLLLFSNFILKKINIGNKVPKDPKKTILNIAIKAFSLLMPISYYLTNYEIPAGFFETEINTKTNIILVLSLLFFLGSKPMSAWMCNKKN